MTDIGYRLDPRRRILSTADYRLNQMLHRAPRRCATVNEYAHAAGIDTAEVIDLLGDFLDDGSVGLELHGAEVFVHTAPSGRPVPARLADTPPNLWELLRDRFDIPNAYRLWQLTRALEAAGWRVEHHPARLQFGLGRLGETPVMGVDVGNAVVPLLLFPSAVTLTAPDGALNAYEDAGAAVVGIVCSHGALDETSTTVRSWMLARQTPPPLSVLILESPRFNPTLLSPRDAAVTPRAVTINTLTSETWD